MKKRIGSVLLALALCLSLLPATALAEDITWPTIGGTVTIGEIGYIYKKDCTSAALDLTSSSYSGNCIFKAGSGYVLWNSTDKKLSCMTRQSQNFLLWRYHPMHRWLLKARIRSMAPAAMLWCVIPVELL